MDSLFDGESGTVPTYPVSAFETRTCTIKPAMDTSKIRPISICLFNHENRILVSEGFDEVDQSYFYRPLGGGIEYGENAEAAIAREIKEELNAEVENIRLLRVVENIFTYRGRLGHEIVFVFDGKFVDKELYRMGEIDGFEHEANVSFTAKWLSPNEILQKGGRLVPESLESLLSK